MISHVNRIDIDRKDVIINKRDYRMMIHVGVS